MPKSHSRKVTEIDPRSIVVHFSDAVRSAFGDLAAAIHFSEHFDGDIRNELQDWAKGKPRSIHSVLIAFPCIAEETSKHIRATDDKLAQKAWTEITRQMLKDGFTLTKYQSIEK
jgi:hypothetical protein